VLGIEIAQANFDLDFPGLLELGMGRVQQFATLEDLQIDGDLAPGTRPRRLMIAARRKSSECVFSAQHRFIP